MSLYRSENNVFCDTVKVKVEVDDTADKIRPSKNFSSPQQPYKLEAVSVKFDSDASGDLNIYAVKSGVELLVRTQAVESAGTVIVSNIGLWLTAGDEVKVENKADQDATAIVDFAY